MAVITQVMINYKATPTQEYDPRTLVLSDYLDSITYYGSEDKGMEESFKEVMKGFELRGPEENVTETILEFGKDHLAEFRSQMIVAAEFNVVSFSFCKEILFETLAY
jgi:hypothetical protein